LKTKTKRNKNEDIHAIDVSSLEMPGEGAVVKDETLRLRARKVILSVKLAALLGTER
jgi:hypothetical protein